MPPPDSLARAIELHQRGLLAEAGPLYEQVLLAEPRQPDALFGLGLLHAMAGRPEPAIELLTRAAAARPDHLPTLVNLGVAQLSASLPADALASLDRALALAPADPDIRYNRGLALKELGRFADARGEFDRGLAARPDDFEALGNLGGVLLALQRPEDALASYRRALALHPTPGAHANCGFALATLRRHVDALDAFERALALRPDFADAACGRADVLLELGRHADALAGFDSVLAQAPGRIDARRGRAAALAKLSRFAEAIGEHDRASRAVASTPSERTESDVALTEAVRLRRSQFAWDGLALAEAEQVARAAAPGTGIHPFELLTVVDDPELQLAGLRAWWATRRAPEPPARLAPATPPRRERIRVGYLSSDYRVHAVAMLVAGLFEAHDRTRFEVLGYSIGRDDGSAMRARIAAAFDRFVDLHEADDRAAARRIAEDGVDVLVDLNGLTGQCRPRILEHRPAPVQVHMLGYAGSIGVDFIDYLIADRFVIPSGAERNFVEAVVRMPHSCLINDRAREIAAETPTREACFLPEAGFVFACFNAAVKIGPDAFALWMRLLAAVPGSVLWLLGAGEAAKANLRREAQARGVDGARLVFAPWAMLPADHLARLRRADLVLDTLPYNAHSTASDALWAGVPLLTCPGRCFAARVAGSLLHAIGCPALIAPDLAGYEALALALARDPARLASLRAKLAANRLTTPLFDTEGFARDLESAITTMVARAQRGERPEGFDVVAAR